MVQFIRDHHHVIHSPITRDTIRIPDPDKKGKWIRKNKLLLQCSVRELFNDLYSKQYGLGDEVLLDDDNNKIISETLLRALLPPELRFMLDRYKAQCFCEYCVLADSY